MPVRDVGLKPRTTKVRRCHKVVPFPPSQLDHAFTPREQYLHLVF
jgi:hypothetical protein